MSITLYNDDCIERMKKLPDKSIDLFITDLPYASKKFGKCVSCKWDTPIELDEMWKQYKRLRKSKNTPMFFFCNVKHGVDLINSNPKMFRRELVWIKSSATGFLNAGLNVGADADQNASGWLYVFNPASTTFVKHFILQSNSSGQGDYSRAGFAAGYWNTTDAVTGIQWKFSADEIQAGTISLYGIG